jgi:hypothetical protein
LFSQHGQANADNTGAPLDDWFATVITDGPLFHHNANDTPQTLGGTAAIDAGQLIEAPGLNAFTVARFTAPQSGQYQIATLFEGMQYYGQGVTTDVHVLKNGVPLFDGIINGWVGRPYITTARFGSSPEQSFSAMLNLSTGDRIDFVVGNGGNGYFVDGTGLSARITLASPDLSVTQPTWTAGQGVDFSYTISGADLPRATTAALYWSADTNFDPNQDTLIPGSVTPTQTVARTDPYPVHVDASAIAATPPPPGTKYLLAVIDPNNSVAESDEPNYPNDFGKDNVMSLGVPDVTIASATVIAPGFVNVRYQIQWPDASNAPLPQPLNIRLFWTTDKALQSDTPAASSLAVISDPNNLTTGTHIILLQISQHPPSRQHYLLSAVNPTNNLIESDVTNDLQWVSPGTGQAGYGVAPLGLRRRLTNPRAWTNEALRRLNQIRNILGPGYAVHLGSIVKPGEHATYEKMDVSIRGNTSWEELAFAAAKAGFWVHAEGVKLDGTDWPLSRMANAPHLDLYNMKAY